MLLSLREIRRDPLGFLQRMTRDYGGVVQFPMPSPATYLVSDPAAVRRVLVDHSRAYDKATVQYRSLSLVTGEGLLTTSGDMWRRQRRMVQPAFHQASLDAVVGHADSATAALLCRWGDVSRGGIIDVDEAMMRVALETVGASLFGTDLSADADRLARSTIEALDVVVSSAQMPLRLPTWAPSQRRLRRAMHELDVSVDAMVIMRPGVMIRFPCARCETNLSPFSSPGMRRPRVLSHGPCGSWQAIPRLRSERRRSRDRSLPTGQRRWRIWIGCPGSAPSLTRRCGSFHRSGSCRGVPWRMTSWPGGRSRRNPSSS